MPDHAKPRFKPKLFKHYKHGVAYYKSKDLLKIVQGQGQRSHSKLKNLTPKPEPQPVWRPKNTASFCLALNALAIDIYRIQSRPHKPGAAVSLLFAENRSSARIARYDDGTIGIQETDCLDQKHFIFLPLNHKSDPVFENNPLGKKIAKWLIEDFEGRKEKLRTWWEDEKNSEAVLEIQHRYHGMLRDGVNLMRSNVVDFQKTLEILAEPLRAFPLDRICTPEEHEPARTASPGSPSAQEEVASSSKEKLADKMGFEDLVGMVRDSSPRWLRVKARANPWQLCVYWGGMII